MNGKNGKETEQTANPRKLLAILGGPHLNGSTAAMLDCAVDAARRAGWEVQTVRLYEKQIGFCSGCRSCIETGRCMKQDDIQEIAGLLKGCDAVALAAPTYWANVPAAVKNMFDRLLGTAMGEKNRMPQPRLSRNQRYLLLTACNTPFPFSWLFGQSRGALRSMEEFFHYAGMRPMGRVAFSGAGGKNGGGKNGGGKKQLPPHVRRRIQRFWR